MHDRHQTSQIEPGIQRPLDAPSNLKRRLAAIAFADVAGFSRLLAVNELETLRRWKMMRSEILEPHMVRHGGRVAEIAGDAVLVEFASVVNAVRWAADVQRSLHTKSKEPDPFALHLRIGINVEDVIDDEESCRATASTSLHAFTKLQSPGKSSSRRRSEITYQTGCR